MIESFQAAMAATHPTDRNGAIRKMFLKMGLFRALNAAREEAGEDAYETITDVPMDVVTEAVKLRLETQKTQEAAETEAEALRAASTAAVVQASEAPVPPAPVVEAPPVAPRQVTVTAPRPAVSVELVRVSPTFPPVQAQTPRPRHQRNGNRRQESRPAPEAERVLAPGECWCTKCPRRHPVKVADAFVPSMRWLKRYFDHAPGVDELIAIAGCRGVFQDEARKPEAERVHWYRLEEQFQAIVDDLASRPSDATPPAPRAAAIRAAAPLAPPPAKKKVAHGVPQARGEIRSTGGGFGTFGDLLAAQKKR